MSVSIYGKRLFENGSEQTFGSPVPFTLRAHFDGFVAVD